MTFCNVFFVSVFVDVFELSVEGFAALLSAVADGVVVDAGSAITIDIISNSIHLGGFILPGIANYKKIYSHISPRLKSEFNTQVSLDAFPQKTMDALSYGVFKGIYLLIKDAAQNKKLYFTGGDGQFLANYLRALKLTWRRAMPTPEKCGCCSITWWRTGTGTG